MADFLHTEKEAEWVSSVIARVLRASKEIPEQVFLSAYSLFEFYDYSHLQDPACLKDLVSKVGHSEVYIPFLDPHYRWLRDKGDDRSFGIIRIDPDSRREDINNILFSSPTDNPANAFCFTCHKCLAFPDGKEWAIYGDREWDIAIAAFQNAEVKRRFVQCAELWSAIGSAEDAVSFMTNAATVTLPERFREIFVMRYGLAGDDLT